MRPSDVYVAVMSYQMGELLENCVTSIARNVSDVKVAIYDDDSKDSETLNVLDRLSKYYSIYTSTELNERDRKTGGLYNNMNMAIENALSLQCKWIMFLQDDMQIVRRMDEDVWSEFGIIVSQEAPIVQIRIHFMKHPFVHSDHVPSVWKPTSDGKCYMAGEKTVGIFDTGLIRLDYIERAGFRFGGEELNNAGRAGELGWLSVFPFNPVAMFLPWPPTTADRLRLPRRALQAVTDRLLGVGFHRFRDMKPSEVERLRERPKEQLPYAERYLSLAGNEGLIRPWWYERSYKFVIKAMRQRGRGLRQRWE